MKGWVDTTKKECHSGMYESGRYIAKLMGWGGSQGLIKCEHVILCLKNADFERLLDKDERKKHLNPILQMFLSLSLPFYFGSWSALEYVNSPRINNYVNKIYTSSTHYILLRVCLILISEFNKWAFKQVYCVDILSTKQCLVATLIE